MVGLFLIMKRSDFDVFLSYCSGICNDGLSKITKPQEEYLDPSKVHYLII